MRSLHSTLYYPSRSNTFRLYHITDTHIGHRGCDEHLFRETVAAIANDELAYWGGGGDYIDAIPRKGDKRYRESSLAPWLHGVDDTVKREEDRFLDIIKPIAHKCLYLAKGNHEDAILSYYDADPYRHIVERIAEWSGRKVDELALGWEGFVTITFRRGTSENYGGSWKMSVYTHHGAGGGRKAGGHALRLEEMLLTYDADVVLTGHRHIHQVVSKQTVAPNGRSCKIRQRIGMFCPSTLASYLDADDDGLPRDNYPEMKNLPPTSVGIAHIDIKPDVRQIVVPIGMTTA
jgi:hypothetical protein